MWKFAGHLPDLVSSISAVEHRTMLCSFGVRSQSSRYVALTRLFSLVLRTTKTDLSYQCVLAVRLEERLFLPGSGYKQSILPLLYVIWTTFRAQDDCLSRFQIFHDISAKRILLRSSER